MHELLIRAISQAARFAPVNYAAVNVSLTSDKLIFPDTRATSFTRASPLLTRVIARTGKEESPRSRITGWVIFLSPRGLAQMVAILSSRAFPRATRSRHVRSRHDAIPRENSQIAFASSEFGGKQAASLHRAAEGAEALPSRYVAYTFARAPGPIRGRTRALFARRRRIRYARNGRKKNRQRSSPRGGGGP